MLDVGKENKNATSITEKQTRNNDSNNNNGSVNANAPSVVVSTRPRTRRAVKEEQEALKRKEAEEEKKRREKEESCDSSLRRSNRNIHSIRLKGTAPTFYRRLQTLFFSKSTSKKGYESVGGNRMKLKRVHRNPPIYTIDNFLTPSDLEYFDERIASFPFQKSFVDNMNYGKEESDNEDGDDNKEEKNSDNNQKQSKKGSDSASTSKQKPPRKRQRRTILDSTHRTSTFFGFRKMQDSRIASLERRVADLLGCWVHQIEALQLVRYFPGQFFGIHHDMGDLQGDDQVSLPPKNLAVKRRLVTIFCYLNSLEDDQGGCTYFPKCGNLRVKPKRGRAVLWSNINGGGLPEEKTIHAGEPVVGNKDVVKYGLNIWICEE